MSNLQAFQLFTEPDKALTELHVHVVGGQMLIPFSGHMEGPRQLYTAKPTRPGQWTKVQLLCKRIHYIRLQSLSSSEIINA